MNDRNTRRAQLGLTLIELMVSIVIGLVVVGAVTYLYMGSRGAYRGNEALARIQEAGRFGLESISRDVRRAGALGCGSLAAAGTPGAVAFNVIAPALSGLNNIGPAFAVGGSLGATPPDYAAPTGWPGAAWVAPTTPPYWGGDVLTLQVTSGSPVRVTGNPDTAAATIPIADNTLPGPAGTANFKAGDFVLLANCASATVFTVSAAPAVAAPSALQWSALGAAALPPLNQPGTAGFGFDSHATVQHFDVVTYYLGVIPGSVTAAFPQGRPALYRYSMQCGCAAEEVVENIEDMDVVYGVSAPGASMATGSFEHANLLAAADWANVISVRVSLLAVGDQNGAAPSGQTILFRTDPAQTNSSTLLATTATDTRLRQTFTATAAIRDRLL